MRPTAALTERRKGRLRGDVGRPLDCCACGGLCWPTGRMGPFQWGSNVLKTSVCRPGGKPIATGLRGGYRAPLLDPSRGRRRRTRQSRGDSSETERGRAQRISGRQHPRHVRAAASASTPAAAVVGASGHAGQRRADPRRSRANLWQFEQRQRLLECTVTSRLKTEDVGLSQH